MRVGNRGWEMDRGMGRERGRYMLSWYNILPLRKCVLQLCLTCGDTESTSF